MSGKNGMRYIALGTRVKPDRETKAELQAPWEIYAVGSVSSDGDWSGPFYKVTGVDSRRVTLEQISPANGNSREYGKVRKYVVDRAIFRNRNPGCVVDEQTAILLLSIQNE